MAINWFMLLNNLSIKYILLEIHKITKELDITV